MITLKNILPRDLKALSAIASADPIRWMLNGVIVHFEPDAIQLVATDGWRLSVFDCGWRAPEEAGQDFLVPIALIKLIPGGWRTCTLSFDGEHVTATDGTLEVRAKAQVGELPKWKAIIPDTIPTEFPAAAVALSMHLLIGLMQLSVKLSGTKGGMSITATLADKGPAPTGPLYLKSTNLLSVLMPMRP